MLTPDLTEALDTAWRLLERGAKDRRSPVHTPAIASITPAGLPDQRTMVLRAASREAATLRFHTDARSPKCAALDAGAVHVLAYHPGQSLQLRLSGTAEVITQGPLIEQAWSASTRFARRCYMAQAAPGSPLAAPGSGLPAHVEGQEPNDADLVEARANFALLLVHVGQIDWLHLAHTGHRRAGFNRDAASGAWSGEWRLP